MSDAPTAARRTTFYDELIRRRRAAWIVAAACALVAGGVSLVLSTIVTPLVLLILGGFLKLVGGFGVVLIQDFVAAQLAAVDQIIDTLGRVNGPADMLLLARPLARLAPVAVPALLAGALVWLFLRGLFARGSSEDLVARLKARPANLADFEERQLANIVEEVAIGAGAPTPRLLLIDTPTINAAALVGSQGEGPGEGQGEGIVLFTRGALDGLDRGETEAVAARLISAIGAGDLHAAAGIMAVFRTFGFFLTVLDLPLRWSAWRTLGGLMVAAVTRRPGADTLGRLGEGLEEALQADVIPELEKIAGGAPRPVAKLVQILLLPFYLMSVFYKLILFLWTAFFLGPPMALLWRNRCYWTDARVVELARNPESFARALEKIGAADPPPGGEAFAYLFIAAPTTARRAIADRRSLALALTPSTHARLARLGAMGATPRFVAKAIDLRALAAHPVRALVLGGLGLLVVPLFAVLFAGIGFLTAIVTTIGLYAGLGIVRWLI